MAKALDPVRQVFGGVILAGDPLHRPPGSATRCYNFRVMPGSMLRLRGGYRRAKAGVAGTSYQWFHEFRKSSQTGGVKHISLLQTAGGPWMWQSLDLTFGAYAEAALEVQSGTQARAIATVRDKVFFLNGLGASTPPFTSWDGTNLRYVGLYAKASGAGPSASFASVAGGLNKLVYHMTFYVGVANLTTGHFSNGVLAGKLTPGGQGTITISNLTTMFTAAHSGVESSELRYVIYATIDGGSRPYLVMNAAGTDILYVPLGTSSVALNLTTATQHGFIHDLTSEMPEENFPPRPMSQIAYVNGRLYGILLAGGTGPNTVYEREYSAVAYSAAADDYSEQNFVGVPEESWPLTNRKFTPNGERPLLVRPAPNRSQALVCTRTGTFLLEQTADGLHVWEPVSWVDGIWGERSYVDSPYGPMWLTQNRQLVVLRPGRTTLDFLSTKFDLMLQQDLLIGTAADFVRDPTNQIERYQVWAGNGNFYIYDFYTDAASSGQAPASITAARSMLEADGYRHHLAGAVALFTHEGHPYTGYIAARDQNDSGEYSEIAGDWIGNVQDFSEPRLRKQFGDIAIVGDGADSPQLGRSPLLLSYFLDGTTNIEIPIDLLKSPQSESDYAYRGGFANPHQIRIRLRLRMQTHSADNNVYDYPVEDLLNLVNAPPNLYGAVCEVFITLSGENRP